ncbi:helix-turn-helix domain-containing protein [Pseudomonas aeruginosa]|uniref:helix-turn-helix domain-containing protein n=1 Tax=Pseudomonas aeruginosa TaxID=287 RepID=UPI000BB834C3|nr:nucleotide excision repair protein [Pseudomonas aeruginosa]EIU2598510.1 helix-turn-helix domain-containing protein [Pseudomonas aeruginosa]EIU2879810.1 helix-turn-helix domain-containing protein [Pseudomonas aeruginosa]ELC7283627.1 helix-turn-helix domain-containing protein [Pseudomonas aeruginosa]ELK4865851.1 helix-turn-helix domain-containing protein [Pseudomonas aeruginosa]
MNQHVIPSDPHLRWEWIKWQLRSRGSSFSRLAASLDVDRHAMTNVKRTPYPRMERAIAEALGLQPIEIWPERWESESEPCRKRPNRAEACHHSTGPNRTRRNPEAHQPRNARELNNLQAGEHA